MIAQGDEETLNLVAQRGRGRLASALARMRASFSLERIGQAVISIYLCMAGLDGLSWFWPYIAGTRQFNAGGMGPLLAGTVGGLVLISGVMAGMGRVLAPFLAVSFVLIITLVTFVSMVGRREVSQTVEIGVSHILWTHSLYFLMASWLLIRLLTRRGRAEKLLGGASLLLLTVFLVRLPSDAKQWGESVGRSLIPTPRVERLFVGQRIPPLRVLDSHGMALTLDDPDVLYVVNFWATWCQPCAEELPRLLLLTRKLGEEDAVRVLAVNTEDLEDDKLSSYLKRAALEDLPVYRDRWGWYEAQGLGTIPMTMLIRNGRILARFRGYGEGMMEKLEASIDEHLRGRRSTGDDPNGSNRAGSSRRLGRMSSSDAAGRQARVGEAGEVGAG